MTTAVFDLETCSIPVEGVYAVDKIHCIAIKVDDDPTEIYTSHYLPGSSGTLRNALEVLNSVDLIIAHNGIGFDCIVVNNILGTLHTPCLDTMLLAKLIYTKDELSELDYTIPDFNKSKYGSFSLEAFGDRMQFPKGSHSDWSKLTTSMMKYCIQDVDVTYQLYQNLLSAKNFPSQSVIDLEHEVAALIAEQVHYGFYYDIENGRALMQKLMHEQLSISMRLSRTFKPLILRKGPDVTPAKPRRTKQYIVDENYQYLTAIAYHPFQYTILKNKKLRFKKYAWFDRPHRIVYTHYSGGDYTPVELTKFDPGSRHKIRHWLKQMYNFEFNTYTDKGNAKVDGDQLEFLGDSAKDLMRYLKVTKDISEVRGILEIVKDHSHSVHGRVDTLGAATHRCTHSSPNVAQTSQDPAFRKLYTAPPGMVLVGADLANIEVRVLAHYLYPYDGGVYAEAVLSKDMHWYHAGIAGFIEPDIDYDEHNPIHKKARAKSKGFFFGYLYGQGDTIRGHTLWSDDCLPDYTQEEYDLANERIQKRLVTINDMTLFPLKKDEYVVYDGSLILKTIYGKRIADTFLERMTGIKELIADCAKQSKDTGYVQAIDGRLLYSRSPHSALNLLLQGSAGVIAKRWGVNYHHLAAENYLVLGTDYWQSAYIHDEYQCPCLPQHTSTLMQCLEDGAAMVTQQFSMNLPIRADATSGPDWSSTH